MSAEPTAAMASAPAPASPDNMRDQPDHHDQHDQNDNGDHSETQQDASKPDINASSSHDPCSLKPTGLHSPPDSNSAMKLDGSDSELSDVEDPTLDPTDPLPVPSYSVQDESGEKTQAPEEEEEDIGDVFPDHWSGTVPVFKPDMHQFKDFKKFMTKIDSYGMKSGIVKIIPPQEWKDKQPELHDLVKQIRVREPIKQDIMGSNGTYRQVNILHQRSYNLPQWRQLCDQSEHQPPARRGERRAQAPPKPKAASSSNAATRNRASGGGRASRRKSRRGAVKDSADQDDRPMTPVSPKPSDTLIESVEQDPGADIDEDDDPPPVVGRMGGSRQSRPKMQSTSARRKFARREGSAKIDEEAFKDWDYKMDISDYTPERCEELERIYWKTLTYAPPLYGADLPGTLFDDSTDTWNLSKLPSLLDVLGTKVPGVNTAYLYLGMWKATFAINYLHFGAPKQWYSISQGDARRFEAAMKSIWPADAKACDQFLRHKAFLISPNHLLQYFNIKVNKCLSYPGEFVVTYPYGYHSGYNLGYNCAEAVNFALDSWLPMGKIAKRCECAQAQDSVWVDVYEIERKLRGEETDYEETEDEEDEDEDEEDELDTGIPTPKSSHAVKFKVSKGQKRKRTVGDKGEKRAKKIRLRIKNHVEPPCCLCPHDIPSQELLPTEDDRKAHRLCALYNEETWIETIDDKEVVVNTANISKSSMDLKCLYCRSKRGVCLKCSHSNKCGRAYHATCAAAAGMLIEEAVVPVFGEDGTEYKEQAFEFSCRFHRTKRDKKLDSISLDDCEKTQKAAAALKKGDICQVQYYKGEIFAGVIIENRDDERTFLLDILPSGCEALRSTTNKRLSLLTLSSDRVEVEWKWLLLPDPADLHLPHASANAIPMPTSRKAKEHINATKKQREELPRAGMPFVDGGFTWSEYNHFDECTNKAQAKVDFSKENQIWYYLGRYSTDARPQYTEDPKRRKHNPKSNFLDTLPKPPPPPAPLRKSFGSTFALQAPAPSVPKTQKPYQYKPKAPVPPSYVSSPFTAQKFAPKPPQYTSQQFFPKYPHQNYQKTQPQQQKPQQQQPLQQQNQISPRYAPYTPTQSTVASPSPYYTFQQMPQFQQGQPQHTLSISQPTQAQPRQAGQTHPYQAQPPQAEQQPTYGQQARPQQALSAQSIHQTQSFAQPRQSHGAQHYQAPSNAESKASQSLPSKTPSLPTPTVSQTSSHHGHVRNKSSLNSLSGRRSLGPGQRIGTPPSSYGPRFDSNTKSPFSHGFTQPPGLGPAPSPQNGSLFQAQARARSSSLASNRSLNTPMTSSAIRPTTAAASALQSVISQGQTKEQNVVQKYAFFQIHHNRDSTKYRTPYAHWGGFTNGYEGNLRAHLMSSPNALFKRQSSTSSTTPGLSSVPRPAISNAPPTQGPHAQLFSAPHMTAGTPLDGRVSQSPYAAPTPIASVPQSSASSGRIDWRRESNSSLGSWGFDSNSAATLHPAIRAHYAAMLQSRNTEDSYQASGEQAKQLPPVAPSQYVASPDTTLPPSSGHRLPMSTTPIPRPSLPMTPTQNTPVPVSLVPPKASGPPLVQSSASQPWEMIQKKRPSVAQPTPTVGVSAGAGVKPPTTKSPVGYSLPIKSEPESVSHLSPPPGLQPSNVSRPFWQKYPYTVPNSNSSQPAACLLQPDTATATATATAAGGSRTADAYTTASIQQHGSSSVPLPAAIMSDAVPEAPELPEVSADGSMDIVESIIRSAQFASGFFAGANGP
ncbi:hypothetical protein F5Y15DRAFT_425937 [Xylariaceae sp. FL0016]|nr:hypothetical protein F5Y15DRAFT_425937 [Xylariaceae sp. FL0016]